MRRLSCLADEAGGCNVGKDAFRRGMDLYFERHDGEAATIEDFVACFAETSGRDLADFMRWYNQPGTPHALFGFAHR